MKFQIEICNYNKHSCPTSSGLHIVILQPISLLIQCCTCVNTCLQCLVSYNSVEGCCYTYSIFNSVNNLTFLF